jgi:hypothetical protein
MKLGIRFYGCVLAASILLIAGWWQDTTLFDRCCKQRPLWYKGLRMVDGKMERRWIAICNSCGAEANDPDALDCMIKWNKMMRGIKR